MLHQRIAAELEQAAATGALPPGSRLPSELELARRHGVSRGTVRQALTTLRHRGVITAVPGKGSFVQAPEPAPATPRARTGTVGVVVPSVARPYVPETLQGIDDHLHQRGWSMVVASSGSTVEQQAARVERIVAGGAAGIIAYPIDHGEQSSLFEAVQRRGVPLVFIDRYVPGLAVDAVTPDNVGGAYAVVAHLVELGHRAIGFVSTDNLTTTSVFERYAGYRQALVTHDLAPDPALELTTLPVSAGRPAMQAATPAAVVATIAGYLDRPERPSAVFALHDVLAMYVCRAAAACGLRVPDQLAVVGFDDDPLAAAHLPPLTTVAQPREAIGSRAAELLVDRLDGLEAHGGRITLPSRLVVRRSCGAPVTAADDEATAS